MKDAGRRTNVQACVSDHAAGRQCEMARLDWPSHHPFLPSEPMHEHDHSDSHDHHEHGSELSETQLRVRALETILTEKGYVDPTALDRIIQAYETKIGPHNGAQVVAKAWSDPAFKRALLEDA